MTCRKDLPKIKENLICTMKNMLKWSGLNFSKANLEKFQFMILGDKTCYEHVLKTDLTCVQPSNDVTLLGAIIDKSLSFKKHVDNLVRKSQYKLHALQRFGKLFKVEKATILGKAFIDSQFNYAPLIWMFCRKPFYSKSEKIHHHTLKVIYDIDDSHSNFLLRSSYVSSHQRHLKFSVTEIFKSIS